MTRLIIFAKAPLPGMAKTRLIPALGPEGAALVAERLLHHTLQQALAAHQLEAIELCMSPAPLSAAWQSFAIPTRIIRTEQSDGDLGRRLARAFDRNISAAPGRPVLLVGTDCPALTAARLDEAAGQLALHDAVLIPASDGGYVLIGLKNPCPELFNSMPWSTSGVAAETLARLARLGLSVWQGEPLHDIDEPADLEHLPAGISAGLDTHF